MTFPECSEMVIMWSSLKVWGTLFGGPSGIKTAQSVFGPTLHSVKVTLKQS